MRFPFRSRWLLKILVVLTDRRFRSDSANWWARRSDFAIFKKRTLEDVSTPGLGFYGTLDWAASGDPSRTIPQVLGWVDRATTLDSSRRDHAALSAYSVAPFDCPSSSSQVRASGDRPSGARRERARQRASWVDNEPISTQSSDSAAQPIEGVHFPVAFVVCGRKANMAFGISEVDLKLVNKRLEQIVVPSLRQ